MSILLVQGNTLQIPLADKSVQCIVTSPPYWQLRSYAGTAKWEGGDAECDHIDTEKQAERARQKKSMIALGERVDGSTRARDFDDQIGAEWQYRDLCRKCGATRHDAQLGSEPLHDCGAWMPVEHFTGRYEEREIELEDEDTEGNRVFWTEKRMMPVMEYSQREPCGSCYICHMRQVARECWRVLRDDGVMFWNIADSYNNRPWGNSKTNFNDPKRSRDGAGDAVKNVRNYLTDSIKPKDKCGIPERTALAFQADGWWWRSDIIWHKPNPMPESVTDRPTKSHEFVYVFTKAERYYWDAEAVKEDATKEPDKNLSAYKYQGDDPKYATKQGIIAARVKDYRETGRNLRDVWTLATAPYSGAHFATFPSELPRRCIKAATSERGACPKCGRAWERIIDYQANYDGRQDRGQPAGVMPQVDSSNWKPPTKNHRGWRPACTCDAGDPVPCVVLDPFSGAATTGLVARELGRHYVGLELSGEYLQQSRERLSLTALDAWGGNGKAKDTDLTGLPLFGSEVT